MERRTLLNSIGPVWDGNEVWLVLAGGVLFAVFPLVYASLFSGFYLAFMLVLLVMILRTVAIEFRSKEPSPRWRSAWDTVFGLASVGLALLLGRRLRQHPERRPARRRRQHHDRPDRDAVAVRPARRRHDGRDVRGPRGDLPRDEDRGRAPGADRARCCRGCWPRSSSSTRWSWSRWSLFRQQITARYVDDIWPVDLPARPRSSRSSAAWTFVRRGRDVPRVHLLGRDDRAADHLGRDRDLPEPPDLDHRPGLQPHGVQRRVGGQHARRVASSSPLIGMPFVLLYTAGVYYFFRGKATVDADGY